MLSSGIPELREEKDLNYVVDALYLSATEKEAENYFKKLIDESLASKFTQVNFFLHNLAQAKFTGANKPFMAIDTLTFIPQKCIAANESRIMSVKVVKVEKLWNPDKFYVYVLRVSRADSTETFVSRRFHQFDEFYHKLCATFPLDAPKMPPFPAKLVVGRSQVRSVSMKRMRELDDFISGLMLMKEEIAHCDLLYTFLNASVQADAGASSKPLKASGSSASLSPQASSSSLSPPVGVTPTPPLSSTASTSSLGRPRAASASQNQYAVKSGARSPPAAAATAAAAAAISPNAAALAHTLKSIANNSSSSSSSNNKIKSGNTPILKQSSANDEDMFSDDVFSDEDGDDDEPGSTSNPAVVVKHEEEEYSK